LATDKVHYPSTRVPAGQGLRARRLHFDTTLPGAYLPANLLANLFECDMGPQLGGQFRYTAGDWTVTTGGTGDTQADAVTSGGGLLITAASDDNFDTTLDWTAVATPVSGKRYALLARIQVSDATGIGFRIGITTGGGAAALPFGTDYTDQVTISKAIASALVVGKVRGNSGTAADTGTLGTIVASTEIEVGFEVYVHATTPAGAFFYNGVRTPMTADQLAQVVLLLTTPATCYWTIHVTGVTATNPTLLVTSLVAGRSR
jgi:hypothetical protein